MQLIFLIKGIEGFSGLEGETGIVSCIKTSWADLSFEKEGADGMVHHYI